MAGAFVSSSSAGDGGSSGTFPVSKPSGAANGDWLVAAQETQKNGGGDPGTPTGWTLLGRTSYSSGYDLACYKKQVSGDGSSYDFNNAPGGLGATSNVRITCWSGVDAPTQITTATGTGTTATATGITTAANNSFLFGAYGINTNAGTTITPTSLANNLGTIGSGGGKLGSAYDSQAVAGASGDKSATLSASQAWGALLVAIPSTATAVAKGGTAAMMGI